jgi:adenosylcobinamide-phosphate synthase
VESELSDLLYPDPVLLLVAAAVDLAVGDPVYPLHPVRIIGTLLARIETALRQLHADGYGGGIALFVILATITVGGVVSIVLGAGHVNRAAGDVLHGFFLYSFLALGDLLRHVWRVEQAVAAADVDTARVRISALVGRDVDRMDGAACRRAAVESLSENLTDGFTSALFWYAVAGLPGLVVFKVVSTMDSMVGYKTPRYLKFGWCGARLDDLMNYVPARLTWLLIAVVAAALPSCSGEKAFRIGRAQHAILLGPNAGWSEAATAGGIQRRLVGPIWMNQQLVTQVWIGDSNDPPVSAREDVVRAMRLVTGTGVTAVIVAAMAIATARAFDDGRSIPSFLRNQGFGAAPSAKTRLLPKVPTSVAPFARSHALTLGPRSPA